MGRHVVRRLQSRRDSSSCQQRVIRRYGVLVVGQDAGLGRNRVCDCHGGETRRYRTVKVGLAVGLGGRKRSPAPDCLGATTGVSRVR